MQSCKNEIGRYCDSPDEKIMFHMITENYNCVIDSLKALKQILNPDLDYHVAVFKKDEQLEFIKFKEMQYFLEVGESEKIQHYLEVVKSKAMKS
jgi:hypothetical protein